MIETHTHSLPPSLPPFLSLSLPKSFPFSSVRLHEIINNNLNETPTRQFQKVTGKERNLLSASISLHPKPLSIARRSAPLNLDRFHGDLEKALSVSPGNTKSKSVILPPLVFPGLSIPLPISFRFLSAPFRYSTN